MSNPRREAVFILARWLESGDFPNRMFTAEVGRAFVQQSVYTVIRNKTALMWTLQRYLKKVPTGELLAVLLLGAGELLFMEQSAPYAVVNEAVTVAKMGSKRSAGVVNAVLRKVAKDRDQLLAVLSQERASIRLSHPTVLLKRWSAAYGEDCAQAIAQMNNTPAETWLAHLDPPRSFERLPRGVNPATVEALATGRAIVQDPATAVAINLMAMQDGLRVLDACAAPGGKCIQLVVRNPSGETVATDLHEDRLAQLREGLARVKLPQVKVAQLAADCDRPDGLFDRILLDVPCSNSGVFRRRPDARWRWSVGRMKRLVELQYTILENLSVALAPDGRLVYSTCSIEPEENSEQIKRFLQEHPTWRLVDEQQLLPAEDHDGAYAAAITRD